MTSNYPYPYQHVTPEEIQALMRRAHTERAQFIGDFFLSLLRRKPATGNAANEPSLTPAACH